MSDYEDISNNGLTAYQELMGQALSGHVTAVIPAVVDGANCVWIAALDARIPPHPTDVLCLDYEDHEDSRPGNGRGLLIAAAAMRRARTEAHEAGIATVN